MTRKEQILKPELPVERMATPEDPGKADEARIEALKMCVPNLEAPDVAVSLAEPYMTDKSMYYRWCNPLPSPKARGFEIVLDANGGMVTNGTQILCKKPLRLLEYVNALREERLAQHIHGTELSVHQRKEEALARSIPFKPYEQDDSPMPIGSAS